MFYVKSFRFVEHPAKLPTSCNVCLYNTIKKYMLLRNKEKSLHNMA